MAEYGFMAVDWEERINFDRLRRERLQKAKDALAKSDLNALFVFRLEDVRYLTGYRCHLGPVTKLDLASVVLPKGGDPILFTLDHGYCKTSMPWMNPNNIYRRPNVRHGGGATKWAESVRSLIGNLTEGKIGIDAWSVSTENALKEAFPKAEFVDGYKVLMQAKMVKTKDELECQRAAAMITEAGLHAALKTLQPGVKECELLATAWQTFTAMGSEWTQCANIVTSGPFTAPYRRFTSDRVIRMGDLVILDIGACFNGYWGDITRTWVCGDIMPTKEQIDLHQECYDTLFNACATARVGNKNIDIGKKIQNPHSCAMSGGHSAGLSPWEPPYLYDLTPDAIIDLKPGMIFNIEPYAGIPGIGGFRLENNVMVTESEPEIYSIYPFDDRLLKDIHPLDKTTGRRRDYYLRERIR